MKQPLIDVRDIAYRLLTPNETLDVRLFDFYGKLHPDVRQQILTNVLYIISNTVKKIEGLVVHDIYINGSAAGYCYTDSSDIDVRIEIHNENCPYLTKDPEALSGFFMALYHGNMDGFRFSLGKRFVDVKIGTSGREIIGLYSVLHDRWEIEPDKNITAGLTYDDIIAEYTQRYCDIDVYLEQIKLSGKLNCEEGINELEEYYRKLFEIGWSDIRNYTVYKLLSYRGVLKKIRDIISNARKEYFSVK